MAKKKLERPAPPTVAELTDTASADWPVQATKAIIQAVDTVRAKTTGPAIKISRGIVYGLLAAFLGIIAFIILLIFVLRIADILLPTWGVYFILSILFFVAGALLWKKRKTA